jgi:RimJ/RimL family protein N-acetyltransferase
MFNKTERTMKIILETQRLLLRELSLEDAAFIKTLVNTPSWIEYIGNRHVNCIEDAETYLQNKLMKSYEQNGFGHWLVQLKETQQSIGICGFVNRTYLKNCDIGFAYLPQFTKLGYAYEMASAVLQFGKETLKMETIVAITMASNTPSIQLLTKLGLHFEKLFFEPNDPQELMLFST